MPFIDFNRLRYYVQPYALLRWLNLDLTRIVGREWRGACPFHVDQDDRERCFAVDLRHGRFFCHWCNAYGDMCDLYARMRGGSSYQAAIEICRHFGVEPPLRY